MNKDVLKRIEELEERVSRLEPESEKGGNEKPPGVIEFDLSMPKAETGGLTFNYTQVHAVFELKEDGWWHSRDILFMSARNVTDDSSRDILSEYLESVNFRLYLAVALHSTPLGKYGVISEKLEVSLPFANEGVKKYNGSDIWYWLKPVAGDSSFCCVGSDGYTVSGTASVVGGCAPMFRVKEGGDDHT